MSCYGVCCVRFSAVIANAFTLYERSGSHSPATDIQRYPQGRFCLWLWLKRVILPATEFIATPQANVLHAVRYRVIYMLVRA